MRGSRAGARPPATTLPAPATLSTKSSSAGLSGSIVKPPPPMARIVGVRPAGRARPGGKEVRGGPGPQVVDLERDLHDLGADLLDAVRLCVRARAHRAVEPVADEVQ